MTISIFAQSSQVDLDLQFYNNKIVLLQSAISIPSCFTIEITFDHDIKLIRDHDYQWVDINQNRLVNEFAPKILRLSNGFYVQANLNLGIWEVNSRNPKQLLWHFNPQFSKPITQYTGANNAKVVIQASSNVTFEELPALLFTKSGGLELSRSTIPFSAVACFTDHCDFDTATNLTVQRTFFKERNIRTTKGFFLNHFSKRDANASFERQSFELDLWKQDGHELCYHSLSQSIKSDDESRADFTNFVPPFSDIPVWIDHGYQPYNFSLFQNSTWKSNDYEQLLQSKGISILWNYIDSGTATRGVINQLNPTHFTLDAFLKGTRHLGVLKRFQALLKTIVFHFLNDDDTISKYKSTALLFKKIVYQKQFKSALQFCKNLSILFFTIAKVFVSWKKNKSFPFKLARYTPLFFKHTIENEEFVVFQTVEVIDFEKALCKENLDLLIKECGIFIAHTYFSDSIPYHTGTMMNEKNQIRPEVIPVFDYLSDAIQSQKIWNPTLSELQHHLQNYQQMVFDVSEDGLIYIKNTNPIAHRNVL